MSQSYNNGFTIPATGDKGTALFTILINLIKRLIDHRHDGSDSVALSATSIAAVTDTISGTWVDQGGGIYRQTVTVPTGVTYSNYIVGIRLSSGDVIHPTIERVSESQYYIYCNEQLTNLKVVYGV